MSKQKDRKRERLGKPEQRTRYQQRNIADELYEQGMRQVQGLTPSPADEAVEKAADEKAAAEIAQQEFEDILDSIQTEKDRTDMEVECQELWNDQLTYPDEDLHCGVGPCTHCPEYPICHAPLNHE